MQERLEVAADKKKLRYSLILATIFDNSLQGRRKSDEAK